MQTTGFTLKRHGPSPARQPVQLLYAGEGARVGGIVVGIFDIGADVGMRVGIRVGFLVVGANVGLSVEGDIDGAN